MFDACDAVTDRYYKLRDNKDLDEDWKKDLD